MLNNNNNFIEVDLRGKLCPYPIAHVVFEVDMMEKGDKKVFLIDDPLAKKSIPEELEDYNSLNIDIFKDKEKKCWVVEIMNGE
jgi:TusA-related sulfurtransferase